MCPPTAELERLENASIVWYGPLAITSMCAQLLGINVGNGGKPALLSSLIIAARVTRPAPFRCLQGFCEVFGGLIRRIPFPVGGRRLMSSHPFVRILQDKAYVFATLQRRCLYLTCASLYVQVGWRTRAAGSTDRKVGKSSI